MTTNDGIPSVGVVIEGPIEEGRQWQARISEVRIDKEQQDGCVEELADEDAVCDFGQLLRMRIIAYPCDQLNSDVSDNHVDHDDNASDYVGRDERIDDGGVVGLAKR